MVTLPLPSHDLVELSATLLHFGTRSQQGVDVDVILMGAACGEAILK